jgi:uncharacterized membrane protein (DUF106 family)
MVVEPIFGFLLAYEPVIAVTIYSIIVLFLINIFYRILVKQNAAKELKAQTKELSRRMREEQKAGRTEEATKLMSEMMQQNTRLMRLTMKPMLISFIIVIILLPFLAGAYPDISVAIKDKTGNFTLGSNRYDVTKDGSAITVTGAAGAAAISCQSACIEKIENSRFRIQEDGQNIKLARIVALLPISLPIIGNTLSWLGWYILVSIPLVVLMRKIMKIYV